MYENKTPEIIKAAILQAVEDRLENSENKLDTSEGSFADDMVGPISLEISKVYGTLQAMEPMIWVNETSGRFLDLAAEDLGIEKRKEGTYAQVELEFQGTPGYVIQMGTSFLTAEGLGFLTTETAAIGEEGLVKIPARAEQVGVRYNVGTGSVLYAVTADSRLESLTNPAPASGGTEAESDSSLMRRIDNARKQPSTSGNRYDYEKWALEVNGVGGVEVYPTPGGVAGTVRLVITDENNRRVDGSVLEDCREHILEMMPVGGIKLELVTPQEKDVAVSAQVTLSAGADLETVAQQFREALEQYFARISLGSRLIVFNEVGGLLIALEGVADYTELALNGGSGNVLLDEESVPVVGEVVLS